MGKRDIKGIAELAADMAARCRRNEEDRKAEKVRRGGGRPRATGPRTPTGQLSRAGKSTKGTLSTRLAHARPLLGVDDRIRLELLVMVSPERLAANGLLDLGKRGTKDPEIVVNMEREALFLKASHAPNASERKDPIGRAWHEGLLDGHGADPKALRDLGREYGYLYWHEYAAADATIGGYTEMLGKGSVAFASADPEMIKDKSGKRWKALSAIVDPLGPKVRIALQKLCVDEIWSLEGPAWLDRLITTARAVKALEKGEAIATAGELTQSGDGDTLKLAIRALLAMTEGG